MQFNPYGSSPAGYQQIADLSEAVGLTVPTAVSVKTGTAVIFAEAQDVRWRDDGDDPTTTIGMLLKAGAEFTYQGDLSAIKFIEVTSGAVLNVSYYNAVNGILLP